MPFFSLVFHLFNTPSGGKRRKGKEKEDRSFRFFFSFLMFKLPSSTLHFFLLPLPFLVRLLQYDRLKKQKAVFFYLLSFFFLI